jgi:hypothetical protein
LTEFWPAPDDTQLSGIVLIPTRDDFDSLGIPKSAAK